VLPRSCKILISTIPKDIYANGGNQVMMIKGNGGDGYVKNVLFQNFISRGTAYGLASISGTIQDLLTYDAYSTSICTST
jgi:hypothetical protein